MDLFEFIFLPWGKYIDYPVAVYSLLFVVEFIVFIVFLLACGWSRSTINIKNCFLAITAVEVFSTFFYWYFAIIAMGFYLLINISTKKREGLFYYYLERRGYNRKEIFSFKSVSDSDWDSIRDAQDNYNGEELPGFERYKVSFIPIIIGVITGIIICAAVITSRFGYKFFP